jgi:uncharacterized membrane protein YccC
MPIEDTGKALLELRVRRVMRLAIGTAIASWIAQAFGWTLSFMAPAITLFILALPVSRPQAKFFLSLLLVLVASIYGSFIFLPMLIHQRTAGLILVALALFHCFYLTARGKPAVLGTLVTMGITITIAVGSVSVDALLVLAEGASFGVLVGVLIAWLMHIAMPDTVAPPAGGPQAPVIANDPIRSAWRALAVVLPVAVWFLFSSSSATNVAVMIKVAAMGQEASTGDTRNAARSLLYSTAAGGLAAVVAWEVLSIWPSLTLYTLLIAIISLYFGGKIFSGYGLARHGDTWSYALLTMVVILAPAVLDSSFGNSANVSFYNRLWMLMGASLYGVGAVTIFDAFWPAAPKIPADGAVAEARTTQ